MKKSLVALLLLSSLLTSNVYAETFKIENSKPSVTAQEQQGKVREMLNIDGVLNMGVKDLAEMMNLDLTFDNQAKVITLNNEQYALSIGLKDNVCKFNGEVINPINVYNHNGSNFLPISEVSRLFNHVSYILDESVYVVPKTQDIIDASYTYLNDKFVDFSKDVKLHAKTTNYPVDGVTEEYYRAFSAILTNYLIDQSILSDKLTCLKSDEELAVFGLNRTKIKAGIELNEFTKQFLTYQTDNYFIPQLSGTKYEEELKILSKKQKEDSVKFRLGLITNSEYSQIINEIILKASQEMASVSDEDYRLYEYTFITYRANVVSRLAGVLAEFHLN